MQNNNRDILFICPDFWANPEIYFRLKSLQETHPHIFYPNVKIYKVFGTFPGCIWNGGSCLMGRVPDIAEMERVLFAYNMQNIGIQFTATNTLLNEQDCYDRYGNAILKLLSYNTELNEVLVASPILESYIRTNYPKLKVSRSIIATEAPEQPYADLCATYEHVVLARRDNCNWELLNQIPEDKRKQIELLCNDPCPIACPKLYEHYRALNKAQLFQTAQFTEETECIREHINNAFINVDLFCDNISPEQLTTYLELGYYKFKLSGRRSVSTIIRSIVPYLILPKYQLDVCCDLFTLSMRTGGRN